MQKHKKVPFNIQDQFLNQARKQRQKVKITMMGSGEEFEALVKSFDAFVIAAEVAGNDMIIYKHAIESIDAGNGFLEKCQNQNNR